MLRPIQKSLLDALTDYQIEKRGNLLVQLYPSGSMTALLSYYQGRVREIDISVEADDSVNLLREDEGIRKFLSEKLKR